MTAKEFIDSFEKMLTPEVTITLAQERLIEIMAHFLTAEKRECVLMRWREELG